MERFYNPLNILIKNIFRIKYVSITSTILILVLIAIFIGQGNVKYAMLLIFLPFLLLILIKPLFGLIISMPLILYLPYIDIFLVSPWNYIIFLLSFEALMILLVKHKIRLNRFSKKILFIFILYIFLTIIINWINGIPVKKFFLDAVILFSTLLVGFCTMFFIKNEKELKIFVYSLIGFMSISAFIGIMQFIGIDFFWKLREFFGTAPAIAPNILARTRIPGLALYSIPFGYQLTSIVPLIFGILTIKKERNLNKYYLLITFIICLLALMATKGRSAIIAGIMGIIMIAFHDVTKKKLLSLIILLAIFALIINIFPRRFEIHRFAFKEYTTPLRISAFIISGKAFLNNPVGTGRNLDKYYATGSSSYFITGQMISPHNHFINILLYYGIFGFLLLILFYWYILKGLIKIFKNNKSNLLITAIAVGLIGSFFSYIINSLFHNMGPFLIDPFNWYLIGIALFLLNNYRRYPKTFFKE